MNRIRGMVIVALLAGGSVSVALASDPPGNLLQGNRHVIGIVEDVKSGQIQVNTGEVQPRFLPVHQSTDKAMASVKKGDRIEITLNEQNLVVDYHLAGQPGTHRIIHGRLMQPLVIGHEEALIRTDEGKEETFGVLPQARSKVASIPVGVEAEFLVDEAARIADAIFASQEALHRAQASPERKSPLKGAHRRVEGTIVEPLEKNMVTIQTVEGERQPYEVRRSVQEKVSRLGKGDAVVLMVDGEDKVMDIATEVKAGGREG
ncbi:hypothetical protein [Candidatus Nitrospira bockiana]